MLKLLENSLEREVSTETLVPILASCAPDVSSDRLKELTALLEGFVRSIPQALSLAFQMSKDQQCGRAVAFATGQILNYVFDEDDLLRDQDCGRLGLLDDAYIVHTFVGMLGRMYPHAYQSAIGYQPPDNRTFNVVRSLLPDGIASALERTCDSLLNVAGSFFATGGGGYGDSTRTVPVLRVSEAVRAMEAGQTPK